MIGAVSASALHLFICPIEFVEATSYCATLVNSSLGMNPVKAIIIEAVLTFTLVFTILMVGISNYSPKERQMLAPIIVGCFITLSVFSGASLTGASMNPARSFGPSLIGSQWSEHYVFWIGPLLGSTIATLFFKFIFSPREALPDSSQPLIVQLN